MQQLSNGYYTGNKYDLPQATHQYNTIAQAQQGMRVETTAQNILLLATNLQAQHQDKLVIEPKIGSSL